MSEEPETVRETGVFCTPLEPRGANIHLSIEEEGTVFC